MSAFDPQRAVSGLNEEVVMAENLLAEGELWLQQMATASPPGKVALMADGPALARRIRSKSVDMQYRKATEFSADIPLLSVLAAKVALISGASDLEIYEADVHYYKIFDSTKEYVEEYEGFKEAFGR